MIIDAMLAAAVDAIKQNLEGFAQEAEGELTPALAEGATLAVQTAVLAAGRAAFRTFLESKETAEEHVVVRGETFAFKYVSEKRFLTLWGQESLARRVYQNAADTQTVVPLDRAWGMEREYLTVEVREAVAYAVAHLTPVEAVRFFKKCLWAHTPHATQVKQAAAAVARTVRTQEAEVLGRIRETETAPEGVQAVVASADGANVCLREPGAAKKGRPAERPGYGVTQAPDTAYRTAMAGVVSFYGAVPEGETTPERLGRVYVSHSPEERAPTFKRKFEAEVRAAGERAPETAVKVILCDGAPQLWKYIETTPLFDDHERLVDFWHATEHLSVAAEALFGKGSEEATRWYARYKAKLLEEDDAVEALLRSMAYYEHTRPLPAARQKTLEAQRTFFTRNRARLAYADFRRRGLPIGSGPVEAACKTLVKARLCQSGMRWSPEGAQDILDLRTYVKSDRWEPMWQHYKELAWAA